MAGTVGRTETDAARGGRFDRGETGEVLYAPEARSDHLPPMEYRDIPEPLPLRKVLGPSVILAGLGVVAVGGAVGYKLLKKDGKQVQLEEKMPIAIAEIKDADRALEEYKRRQLSK